MVDIDEIYHVTNPLHIFCRLIGCGLNPKAARKVSNIYERTIWKTIKWTLRTIS